MSTHEVRSQLAANVFLTKLVQWVSPNTRSFTYSDVAVELRLDVKYVQKMLSRLAKRGLLHALRGGRLDYAGTPRGFLNLYSVSNRGWSKARYLLNVGQADDSTAGEGDSFLLGASRAQVREYFAYPYLLNGKGTAGEFVGLGMPLQALDGYAPVRKPRQANMSAIMIGVDSRFVVTEGACSVVRHSGFGGWDLPLRVMGLQKLGLTPTDVCAPVYAMEARYLGNTDDEIYISLLARRCVELAKRELELNRELANLRQ